jgi:ankyrin repeat protein
MWAAAESHPDVVKTLVEAGADVRARSRVYPVNVVGEDTQRAGREELTYTIQAGGLTPLLFTSRSGDVESARVLLAAGADPNDHLADGTSALAFAAFNGRTAVATLLLDKGADPNDMGAGHAPLHAAILKSDVALVKALLAHGANPELRITKGTPKRRDSEDFNLQSPLIGSTAFLLAAKFAEPEILRTLIATGVDTKVKMPNGANALMLAAGMNSIATANRRNIRMVDFGKMEPESQVLEAVQAVMSAGLDVNDANQAGDTALHSAAALGYTTVIQYLVDSGADVNAKNKRGLTPLAALTSGGRRGGGAADADPDAGPGVSVSGAAALLRKLGGQ